MKWEFQHKSTQLAFFWYSTGSFQQCYHSSLFFSSCNLEHMIISWTVLSKWLLFLQHTHCWSISFFWSLEKTDPELLDLPGTMAASETWMAIVKKMEKKREKGGGGSTMGNAVNWSGFNACWNERVGRIVCKRKWTICFQAPKWERAPDSNSFPLHVTFIFKTCLHQACWARNFRQQLVLSFFLVATVFSSFNSLSRDVL